MVTPIDYVGSSGFRSFYSPLTVLTAILTQLQAIVKKAYEKKNNACPPPKTTTYLYIPYAQNTKSSKSCHKQTNSHYFVGVYVAQLPSVT